MFGVVAAILTVAEPCPAQPNVEAHGGVAVGGNVTNSQITFGLKPEEVKELTEAAARGATAPLTDTIVELSKRIGVTEDATKTLLRIVGKQDVPLERLSETLNSVANDYKRLQAQAAALNPDNPTARDLVARAKAAIDIGQFEQAHQLLREATQAQLAAAQTARTLQERAQAAADAQMLGAASASAVEAGVALTEGKYREAAELFGQAAEYVPPDHQDERGKYLSDQASAFCRQGDERGDNEALRSCIAIRRLVLERQTRERMPLQWARTQGNLGNALKTLGEREADTAHLDQAVDAYRAALTEFTHERVPLDWARTQNNLGNALKTLGEREADTARLEQAVDAYRAALTERTHERVPLDWATTQNNLGNALWRLGERESGTARLEQAVDAYRAALTERTRKRVPLDWATTQTNLGNALWRLGERESGTARLEQAVEAYRAALTERTR
jgi:tetratricopeptide (TPR) repeat protein